MNRPVAFYVDIPMKDGTVRCRLTQRLREQYQKWEVLRHSTSDYELHVQIAGSVYVCFDSEKVCMEKGKALLIAPDVSHQPFEPQSPFKRFYIHFSVEGAGLRSGFQRAVRQFKLCDVPGEVASLAENLVEELIGAAPYRKQVIESMLSLLVLKVFRQAEIVVDEPFYPLVDGGLERRNIMESFFQMNMAHPGGEAALAEQLGVSTRQLLRLMQEYYGMSYREKMAQNRMDHAAWLLRTTEEPIIKIAETVGYASEETFRKAFRVNCGMTPKQYRNQNEM